MRSDLRQGGAFVVVLMLAAGTVAGCGFNKGGTAISAPPITEYKPAAALAANLASLDGVSGPLHGTMKIGSETRTLTGTATLNNHASQVELVESGKSDVTRDEIVVGNHSYKSDDDKIWIDRGTKVGAASLAAVLAAADTTRDAGVSSIDGVTAHKILTGPDKVDVAPALGIDTETFDNESTTLRVWADDAGKPVGFGATMSWQVTLGGVRQNVTTELDVMFTYTTPAEIKVPAAPWQWVEDQTTGIAFGLPGGWGKSPTSTPTYITYAQTAERHVLVYSSLNAEGMSLSDAMNAARSGLSTDTRGASNTESATLGSEPAQRLATEGTKSGDYGVMVVSIHETMGYIVYVAGPVAGKAAIESLADQILSTVEFTR